MSTFIQDAPHHENVFRSDAFLRRCLKRLIPKNNYSEIELDLHCFGDRVRGEIWQLGQQCEMEQPKLRPVSAWGHSDYELVTSDSWKAQKTIVAEEGLVAIPYEVMSVIIGVFCSSPPSSGSYEALEGNQSAPYRGEDYFCLLDLVIISLWPR